MEQSNKPEKIDCDSPVTIIVKRRPKQDRIEDFEKVMSDTTKDAMTFEGHLGANIIRPTKAGDYYRIVFKFDSMRHYLAWEGSEIRQQWLECYAEVTVGEQELEILSGLETWFTIPGGEALVPPPKYKMMLIVWFSIFPLISGLTLFSQPLNQPSPYGSANRDYLVNTGLPHDLHCDATNGKIISSLATLQSNVRKI